MSAGPSKRPKLNLNGLPSTSSVAPSASIKTERLPSFKKERDLLLGADLSARIKATDPSSKKPIFKPNLNVARNRNADVRMSASTAGQRGGRGGTGSRGRGGRGGASAGPGKRNSNLIQTAGLFSEGVQQTGVKRSAARAFGSRSSNSVPEVLVKPKLAKVEIKADPEEENKHLQDILGDDEEYESDDEKLSFDHERVTPKTLEDAKIKSEKKKSDKLECLNFTNGAPMAGHFEGEGTQLFLMQLPDHLPSLPPDPPPRAEGAEENSTLMDGPPEPPRCTIRDLPEGQIGELVRYRSGKVKMVLGDFTFDVTEGAEHEFLQQVVSVSSNPDERSGSIFNLGQIMGKLNVTPDWSQILDDS